MEKGPLRCIYSWVKMIKLYDGEQHIMVFFYNQYAEVIEQFLSKHNNRNTKITLQGIPTYKCKLPYTSERVLLGDVRYCLCIGDQSKVVINNDYKLRFDSTNVTIEIVIVEGNQQINITNDGGKELIIKYNWQLSTQSVMAVGSGTKKL